jgi:hypothetical protein
MKFIGILIAFLVSWIALRAISSSPAFHPIEIKSIFWLLAMSIGGLFSVFVIFKRHQAQPLSKRQAMWIAVFLGIFFSTYLEDLFTSAVMMLMINCFVAALIGLLLSHTTSLHKREDLLIFLWCYAPIKFITIIALLKGSLLVKNSAPFISLFIMAIAVMVMRFIFHTLMKKHTD